ncbi:unnamed protein product [Meloidogyne enterolobii]|uniref:Uncharacterized protein n=1 Tax=Meloidogyne enterolobii TaxID=390850 RepID=A0ACB1AZV1_MELEN
MPSVENKTLDSVSEQMAGMALTSTERNNKQQVEDRERDGSNNSGGGRGERDFGGCRFRVGRRSRHFFGLVFLSRAGTSLFRAKYLRPNSFFWSESGHFVNLEGVVVNDQATNDKTENNGYDSKTIVEQNEIVVEDSDEPNDDGTEQKKIFCGGISYDTTGDDLASHFSQFGSIKEAQVKYDRMVYFFD